MKLNPSNKSSLFSSTEIPNAFFTDYLPEAKSEFVKVYFYILFLANNNSDIKINDLSKTLSLDFPVVQDAIKYWEEQRLLIKNPQGYSLANIQEIQLNQLYTPKTSLSPETIAKNAESMHHEKVFDTINAQFFSGTMSPLWYSDIELWFQKYGFDEQVMIALFNYSFDNKALNRQYVSTVASGWSREKIKTFSDLENYFNHREQFQTLCRSIAKKLKLSRNLTEFDEEYVHKWYYDYKYDINIIEIALKKASNKNSINFKYIDTILSDWHEKALNTVDEVNTYLASIKVKDKKEKKPKLIKKLEFEYTQSTFDNWDALYDN